MRYGSRKRNWVGGSMSNFGFPTKRASSMQESAAIGAAQQEEWERALCRLPAGLPRIGGGLRLRPRRRLAGRLGLEPAGVSWNQPIATRAASGAVLDAIAPHLPALLGGSADLTPSNNTLPKGEHDLTREDFDRQISPLRRARARHGVGILNGLALHGGVRPLRRHIPHFFGLHAPGHSSGGSDGNCR